MFLALKRLCLRCLCAVRSIWNCITSLQVFTFHLPVLGTTESQTARDVQEERPLGQPPVSYEAGQDGDLGRRALRQREEGRAALSRSFV
jgi:hypothetical protein